MTQKTPKTPAKGAAKTPKPAPAKAATGGKTAAKAAGTPAARTKAGVQKAAGKAVSPAKAATKSAAATSAAPSTPSRKAKAKSVVAAEGGHPPGGIPGEPEGKATAAGKTGKGAAKAGSAKAGAAKAAAASGAAKAPAKRTAASAAKPAKAAGTKAKAAAKGKKALPKSSYTRAEADQLFQRLADALPEPQTELEYTNPYTLLVAVALSAQATDVGVNRATRALFAVADTPQKMVDLGEEKLRDYIKTIGLFNTKAKNVMALSRTLVETYGGEVPQDRTALQSLPGVGRKTANVVLNVAFGEPTIAVDTHIFRVANRLGLAPGKTPDDVEKALEAIVPERFLRGAHHWLILHGRHVCKARRPLCEACVIYELCKAPDRRPLPHA